jgi:hypothetical protein
VLDHDGVKSSTFGDVPCAAPLTSSLSPVWYEYGGDLEKPQGCKIDGQARTCDEFVGVHGLVGRREEATWAMWLST